MKIELTPHQQQAFEKIKAFVTDKNRDVFVLRGYAGTGKTTLVRFLLDWLENQGTHLPVLLASTGRAAKVLSALAKHDAATVHSHIYKFDVMGGQAAESGEKTATGQLTLNFELRPNLPPADNWQVLYVVDEASMLSHLTNDQNTLTKFGSGNLLLDFFHYAGGHKILFVGDAAQLPPVAGSSAFSPALNVDFLRKHFNKNADGVELTTIMRQAEGHAILDLATRLRNVIISGQEPDWEDIMTVQAPGIYRQFSQQRMVDRYLQVVGSQWDKAIILTHPNKQAFYLNDRVRRTIYNAPPPHHLVEGELLMVVQNSYYVPLANGDQVIVKKVKPAGKRAGFHFLETELQSVHDGQLHKTMLLHDFLFRPEANLDPEKQRSLLIDFDKRARKRGLKRNSDDYKKAMLSDPWLNALRAKFGYAVTCHKAQGGEWPAVFLNLSETIGRLERETRFRWLYTAVTRAREALNLKPVWKGHPKTTRR